MCSCSISSFDSRWSSGDDHRHLCLERLRALVFDVAPVVVGRFDATRHVFQPLGLNSGIQIQIQLLVDDSPNLRIADELLANRYTECAVATKCRNVLLRVLLKCLLTVGAGELIRSIIVDREEVAIALENDSFSLRIQCSWPQSLGSI